MERILIIDDEEMNLRLSKFILQKAGYEVETVNSGTEGIEILQKIRFDLVLLDVEMPDMNGLDVLRVIRSCPEIAGTKVIFLTASNSPSNLSKAAKLEAVQFILKPCMPEVLLKAVRNALDATNDVLLLIVDDEPMNLMMMKRVFSSLYRVECVSSGQAALNFLERETPDMVLLDLYMPEMDGRETFKRIRAMDGAEDLPVVFVTAEYDEDIELELFQMGALDFIKKPFIAGIIRERIRRLIELRKLQNFLHEEVERRTVELRERTKELERQSQALTDSNSRNRRLSEQIILALAGAIDAKDAYTNGHSRRVAKYTRMLATRMGKSEEEISDIYYAAMLHDVGKIGIPLEIISKPGSLTDAEFAEIQKHTVKGEKILKMISEMPSLQVGARWHHERYDGRGYPDGLSGENIPEIARIICVADSYDAMSSNRSYRNALAQDVIRGVIFSGKGKQFDPDIADIMLEMIDEDTNYDMREKEEEETEY
ncbi:MAG: response regulator [Lachnospiraceae bacterium]|nr:response regulator [Lachnospiraceae bacterium]